MNIADRIIAKCKVVWDFIQKYNVTKVLVDASAPSFIRALKLQWGERSDYENVEQESARIYES